MSYYKILGISSHANYKQIREAYLQRAKKVHSDKGGSDAEFQKLVQAYEVLSVSDRRRDYDRICHASGMCLTTSVTVCRASDQSCDPCAP